MKTIVVTGAAGFLGSALSASLVEAEYNVIGIDRRNSEYLSRKICDRDNFHFIKSEIDNALDETFKDILVDAIFHLASQQPSSPDISYDDFYKGNVESTQRVISSVKENKVKALIYTSTTTVLGKDPGLISEDSSPAPYNYYGLTKYIAERLLEFELRDTDTKTVIIRYPSLVGKYHLGGMAYTYYTLAKGGKNIDVFSKGQRLRSVLHVSNAVDILIKVLNNLKDLSSYELFTAGSCNSLKTAEIALIIKDLLGSSSKVVPVNSALPLDIDILIDTSKSQRILNFVPPSVKEVLCRYVKEMNNEV